MAAPVAMMDEQSIMVTGALKSRASVVASEEDLADLKLYRVPEPVTVAAKSQKQVAFLDRDGVTGRLLYQNSCGPWTDSSGEAQAASIVLATVNDERHGLGAALPTGSLAVFEQTSAGEQLVARKTLRDYAAGQDVEIELGESAQVFAACSAETAEDVAPGARVPMKLVATNANPAPIQLRIALGDGGARIGGLKGTQVKDGARIFEVRVPANGRRELRWTVVNE